MFYETGSPPQKVQVEDFKELILLYNNAYIIALCSVYNPISFIPCSLIALFPFFSLIHKPTVALHHTEITFDLVFMIINNNKIFLHQ